MKKILLSLAILAGASFANWTPSSLVRNSYYNIGCGVDAGTVQLCVAFNDSAHYCLVSTDPLYPQASALADLSVASGHPVQVYAGSEATFQYANDGGGCSTTAIHGRILGISIDKN